MIFVGNGALIKSAVDYASKHGYKIDMVFCPTNELASFFDNNGIAFTVTDNINNEEEKIQLTATDKIIFSVNNAFIFQKKLLSLPGFRYYNIHNGIIPQYKGRPAVCVIFAILNGEREYGVSLHEIDEGIDSGNCIEIRRFPIKKHDTFEKVMNKGIQYCHEIFCDNLDKIVQSNYSYTTINNEKSYLYTMKSLDSLQHHLHNPRLKRAIYLGVFSIWYKDLYNIVRKLAYGNN